MMFKILIYKLNILKNIKIQYNLSMKRDKNQKMPKTNNETLPYIDPAPFNQTIIINNPNININYINQGGNAKHNNHKTII